MSQNGHTETVRVLAACVVDTHKANNNGETPFWVSAVHGHTETVPVLKACGTDITSDMEDGSVTLLTDVISLLKWLLDEGQG